MEKAIVDTIEAGFMTKDLAILVYDTATPARTQWLNTFEFIDKVAEFLNKALGK